MKTETIEYKQGDVVLEGYLAYDESLTGKRPGILVVHDLMGSGPYVRNRAEQLAKLGYVAFAADIYGKGVRPESFDEAIALITKYKSDRPLFRKRVAAGLAELKKNEFVDPERLASMGYCFGGTASLELARSGGEVAGVVSFHGSLDTPTPEDAKNIRCKVLVLHGADDPRVPPAQVEAFQDEMRKAGVDWQLIFYGNAVHGFTNPNHEAHGSKGFGYNEKADKRSWQAMKTFFDEIFSV